MGKFCSPGPKKPSGLCVSKLLRPGEESRRWAHFSSVHWLLSSAAEGGDMGLKHELDPTCSSVAAGGLTTVQQGHNQLCAHRNPLEQLGLSPAGSVWPRPPAVRAG